MRILLINILTLLYHHLDTTLLWCYHSVTTQENSAAVSQALTPFDSLSLPACMRVLLGGTRGAQIQAGFLLRLSYSTRTF